MDQIEMIRKSSSEKAITERVKLLPRKRKTKKNSNCNQNLNSIQTINQTSSIISSIKSLK